MTWSDEFNGPNGAGVDPSKWVVEVGGKGWGNQELEYYTSRRENAQIQDGNLVIEARRENYTGTDGVSRNYTSARLKTAGKFSQAYGRFDARIKIPSGQGMWPAFWMLGDDIDKAGWPRESRWAESPGSEQHRHGVSRGTADGPDDGGVAAPQGKS